MFLRALPVVLVLSAALAQGAPVQLTLRNRVVAGQQPSLSVRAVSPIARVQLDLSRAGGRHLTFSHGALAPGQSATFTLDRAAQAHWTGTLSLTLTDGRRTRDQLSFDTSIAGKLRVTYRRDHLDLERHLLEFQLDRPAGSAQIRVIGDDGTELGHGEAHYHHEAPGSWLPIRWTQRPGNVLRLELHVLDAAGDAVSVKLLPWSVQIPHQEVVFATGQSAIAPSEAAKLDASYTRIVDIVAKVRRFEPQLPVQLFIAGHTDTVGSAEDNRKLSTERAQAIARFFRDRGLPLPISYAGFGEDVPKVKTPDNTDEPANRRADYIVGVEAPAIGHHAHWIRLQ